MSNLDELREKLFEIAAKLGEEPSYAELLIAVFSQYLEQETLKARIDELDRTLRQYDFTGIPLYQGWKKRSMEWRIRELSDQLSTNKSKEK